MTPIDLSLLSGTWLHSREEDEGASLVFRPEAFSFPRARGREGFELSADGTMRTIDPGRDDRTEYRDGTWHVEQTLLKLDQPGLRREFEVVSQAQGKLVLRPFAQSSLTL